MVRAAAPTMGELLARVDALDPRRANIPAGFQPQARGVGARRSIAPTNMAGTRCAA